MKCKVIKVDELNELLQEFKEYSFDDETFEDFVLRTKDNGVPIVFEVDEK